MTGPEEKIKESAYDIWVAEGCPQGMDYQNWMRAWHEVSAARPVAQDNHRVATDLTPVRPNTQNAGARRKVPTRATAKTSAARDKS